MAANSARLIVCLSGCDLTSTCVIVRLLGFPIDAPCVGLPDFYPSVYMNLLGFHAAWKCRMGYRLWREVCRGIYG